MASLSPVPALHDLKLIFKQSILVFPEKKTENRSIFLSNIDQILNYNIPTAHFFKAKPDFPPEIVAERLKRAVEKVLVHYDFMAGRLKLNRKNGRHEIDCNAAGVGFFVASSEFSLAEIEKYLIHPNLGYRQLVTEWMENLEPEDDQPMCFVQVTSFSCGGFCIGLCSNHTLLDGVGARAFILNLASQAFDGEPPLAVTPVNDRHLIAARSPPQVPVSFSPPEFLKLDLPVGEGSSPPTFDCNREELDFRILKFSPSAIDQLKNEVKSAKTARVSSLAVAAALIWRCKALSKEMELSADRVSHFLNVIDIRSRLNPPLPLSYGANAVLVTQASATCEQIEAWPLSILVDLISEGPKKFTDDYIKSTVDWLEVNRGVPNGEYMVSSWLRLGFDEVVYPWGKPIYSCAVVHHRKDICFIFPDAVGGGFCAMVALPPPEMARFEFRFREFLPMICTPTV